MTSSLVTLAQVSGEAVLSLRLTVLAEDLLELQGTALDDRAEAIGFHEAELHREVVADLVIRLLDVGQTDAALSVAEHARARTLRRGFHVAGDLPAPPLSIPSEAGLADLLPLLADYVVQRRRERGLATRLTGPELRDLVAQAGRPALLLHPSASGLVRFLLRPDGSGEVDVQADKGSDVVEQVAELQRALGTELTAVSRGEADQDLLAALQLWADEPAPEPVDATEQARRRLHDLVFGDLALPEGSLALVPFRELALLPYPALVGEDGSTLLDRHALSVLPSLRSLAGTSLMRERRRAVVLGAPHHDASLGLPPLTHAADEASEVVALLASAIDVAPPLLGDAATEVALRQEAHGAGILHLACHAAVGGTPSESALYLTPGPHDDGAVRLEEAEDLLLDDALVVLAACQTGLGRATADGVVGLGQSFVRAGARCVVLSLWRVGDASTAALMGHFYRLLVGTPEQPGVDVAAALAGAQRLTRGRFPHVAQWGPWLVTGDGGWRFER